MTTLSDIVYGKLSQDGLSNLASELDVRDLIERVIYITLNFLDWYFIFRTAPFIPTPSELWSYGDNGYYFASRDDYLKKNLKVESESSSKYHKVQKKTDIDFGIFTLIKYGFYGLHVIGLAASVIMNLLSGVTLILKPSGPGSKFGLVWWMDKYTIYS